MTDTAEYWADVKSHFAHHKHTYTHLEGFECGHYHVFETTKLLKIDCKACLEIIESDQNLSVKLEYQKTQQAKNKEVSLRNKKGYKLSSIIKFGKYKGHQKTIQWIIDNDNSYFQWMKDKVLFHTEVDRFNNPLTTI